MLNNVSRCALRGPVSYLFSSFSVFLIPLLWRCSATCTAHCGLIKAVLQGEINPIQTSGGF